MFSVGAIDAYFFDAYTDLVAATLQSESRHTAMILPETFQDIKLPVRAVVSPAYPDVTRTRDWLLAMAAKARTIDAPPLPDDLAENHDHYAHAAPKR